MPLAVILTALPVEYLAVRSHLVDLREEMHPQGTIYERGTFAANGQTWDVGIAEVGAGNAGAAVEAERAIAYFKPNVLFFVGIAGGIKDVEIGDVVAATDVYAYEIGKAEGQSFLTRPKTGSSAHTLVQRAKSEARKEEWLQRLSKTEASQPRVFVAPIAAGEKVIASKESEIFKFIRASYNDAVAVEMEGFGFLQASFAYPEIQAIVIRGISDLIKDKNVDNPSKGTEDQRQKEASCNASAFAFEILSKLETNSQQKQRLESKAKQAMSPNFFAYDDAWVGRDSLIQELSDRMRYSCRLMILLGITGIGKTALGERLAIEISDWFNGDWSKFHQENLENSGQSLDFASVAARWLEKWGELITPDDRKDPQRLLNRLTKYLRENRYLIQIDSLEYILEGDEERGWSGFKDNWWVKFFENYLKSESCQSCIVLTSQDLPGQLENIGNRCHNFWYPKPLPGLNSLEQLNLFSKVQLDISSSSESKSYLERIGCAYEGHPLALRVIAGEIKNKPFNGNILAYWKKYGNEVEQVEKAIVEAQEGRTTGEDRWQIDRFTDLLRARVRSRLNDTFGRLKKDAWYAYVLICEASVYRCPVPEDWWLSHLEDWDQGEEEQKSALKALKERYLVEVVINDEHEYLLRQHNLIRSTSLEFLKIIDAQQ